MSQDFAFRLRQLKKQQGWTTADMAERSGLPKRSLEKYMLREGASQPGYEALVAMARGFGVSLDWLVFGSEVASEYVRLLTKKSAFEAALTVFESVYNRSSDGSYEFAKDGELLGLTLEYWSALVRDQAEKSAQDSLASAVTKEQLLTWAHAHAEQMQESHRDWISRVSRVLDEEKANARKRG